MAGPAHSSLLASIPYYDYFFSTEWTLIIWSVSLLLAEIGLVVCGLLEDRELSS